MPSPIMIESNLIKDIRQLKTYSDFEESLPDFVNQSSELVLLSDYDGTLAAITQHPNDTCMTPDTKDIFEKLCAHPRVYPAVISGRCITDIMAKVGLNNITYAGNHGIDILFPNGTQYSYPIPEHLKTSFPALFAELQETVAHDGTWIEDKKSSITVHYRETPEELHDELIEKARKIATKYGYVPNKAHFAIEVKPPVNWHKGEAAILLLKTKFGDNWSQGRRIIYAGDDTTDEDVMRSLKGIATTFRISRTDDIKTFADYRLTSTDGVNVMLHWLYNSLNSQ